MKKNHFDVKISLPKILHENNESKLIIIESINDNNTLKNLQIHIPEDVVNVPYNIPKNLIFGHR